MGVDLLRFIPLYMLQFLAEQLKTVYQANSLRMDNSTAVPISEKVLSGAASKLQVGSEHRT